MRFQDKLKKSIAEEKERREIEKREQEEQPIDIPSSDDEEQKEIQMI